MQALPSMVEVAIQYPSQTIHSIPDTVYRILEDSGLKNKLAPGHRVAITAGSRGINNIVLILKTIVSYLASCGCQPYIIAAMGSHGGGTVEGQLSVLRGIGITPDAVGAPVLASDRCVSLPDGQDLWFLNAVALDFDHILVVNRIKPHTSFHGPAESGLQKMLAVGLGGPQGASRIHALGIDSLPNIIPKVSKIMARHLPVTLGIAILEDAYENTMAIEAVPVEAFVEREKILLERASDSMPLIPFQHLDILVVDEIGKTYSGTGMDTNVIGRLRIQGVEEPQTPNIKHIVVLGLADGSRGNAYGIGLADFTTQKLADSIDHSATYLNAITSTFVLRAMIPMILPDDLSAIQAAINILGPVPTEKIRMVRIKNTLHLDRMLISEALLTEALGLQWLHIIGEARPMDFDLNNNLLPF